MRASERTSLFWSSRNWNSSGIAADFSCWTSSASGSIGMPVALGSACALRVDLAGDGAQRGLDRRPVGFLRGGKLQALLDPGDLDVAEQRVILLRLRLVGGLRLGGAAATAGAGGGCSQLAACRYRPARSRHRPGAAELAQAGWACRVGLLRRLEGGQRRLATASRSFLLSLFETGR